MVSGKWSYRVLPGLTGSYWVLPNLTGSYQDLLGLKGYFLLKVLSSPHLRLSGLTNAKLFLSHILKIKLNTRALEVLHNHILQLSITKVLCKHGEEGETLIKQFIS